VLALLLQMPNTAEAQELATGIAENLARGRSATDFNSRVRLSVGYLELPRKIQLLPTRASATWPPDPRVARAAGPLRGFGITSPLGRSPKTQLARPIRGWVYGAGSAYSRAR